MCTPWSLIFFRCSWHFPMLFPFWSSLKTAPKLGVEDGFVRANYLAPAVAPRGFHYLGGEGGHFRRESLTQRTTRWKPRFNYGLNTWGLQFSWNLWDSSLFFWWNFRLNHRQMESSQDFMNVLNGIVSDFMVESGGFSVKHGDWMGFWWVFV